MQLTMGQAQAQQEWILQSFAEHSAEEFTATTDRETNQPKLFEGHETYRVPLVVIGRKSGRPETAVYIKVLSKPAGIGIGEYLLTGEIRVTPFVMQGRIAYSIVADAIAPKTAQAQAQEAK